MYRLTQDKRHAWPSYLIIELSGRVLLLLQLSHEVFRAAACALSCLCLTAPCLGISTCLLLLPICSTGPCLPLRWLAV